MTAIGNRYKDLLGYLGLSTDARELAGRVVDLYESQISAHLGNTQPRTPQASLVYTLVDDSESMGRTSKPGDTKTNAQLVAAGYNQLRPALLRSTGRERLMFARRTLNSGDGHNFLPLQQVPPLPEDFNASGQTPLFDRCLIALTTLLIKAAMLRRDNSVRSATTLLIMGDGFNEGQGHNFTADDFRLLNSAMMKNAKRPHVCIAIGVQMPGASNDYRHYFGDIMGITADNIYEISVTQNPSKVREIFDAVTDTIAAHTENMGTNSNFGMAAEKPYVPGDGVPTTLPLLHEDDVVLTGDLSAVHDGDTDHMPLGPDGEPFRLDDPQWNNL